MIENVPLSPEVEIPPIEQGLIVPPEGLVDSHISADKYGFAGSVAMPGVAPEQDTAGKVMTELREYLEPMSYHGRVYGAETLLAEAESLVSDQPEIVREVALSNSFMGHQLTKVYGKWLFGDEQDKAARFLNIFKRDVHLAEAIAENSIAGFHATSSGALLGVVKYGLMPASQARAHDDVVLSSGERTFSIAGGQRTISFTDWREPDSISRYLNGSRPQTVDGLKAEQKLLDQAARENEEMYGENHPFVHNSLATIKDHQALIDRLEAVPDSIEARLVTDNFPIAFGISASQIDSYERKYDLPKDQVGPAIIEITASDIPGEFTVTDTIPIEKLPVIAVPEQRIAFVEELLKQNGVKSQVVSLQSLVGQ